MVRFCPPPRNLRVLDSKTDVLHAIEATEQVFHDMEVKESMRIIQCKSEGDAQELMAQFQKVAFTAGSKLHVTREHITPTPSSTHAKISAPTPAPASSISAIQPPRSLTSA